MQFDHVDVEYFIVLNICWCNVGTVWKLRARVVWRFVCFVLVVLFCFVSVPGGYGWWPRFHNSFKIHPPNNISLATNNTRKPSKSIHNPSKINQTGAQERSESDHGSKSAKKQDRLWETCAFLAPLGRFWVPFGIHLGAKGLPESAILASRRAKKLKNEAQNKASEKVWFFDWIVVRKCEIVNVVNSPKCFIYKYFGVFSRLCESWEVHWTLKLKQSSKWCKIVLVGYLWKAVSF